MRLSNDAIPPRAKASWLPCYGSVIKELGANTYLSVFPIMTIDPFDVRKYTIAQLEQKIKIYLLMS